MAARSTRRVLDLERHSHGAGQGRAGQGRAGQGGTELDSAGQSRMVGLSCQGVGGEAPFTALALEALGLPVLFAALPRPRHCPLAAIVGSVRIVNKTIAVSV